MKSYGKENKKGLAFFCKWDIIELSLQKTCCVSARDRERNEMKLAKIALPFSVVALVVMLCAVLLNKGVTAENENQLALGLGLFFVYVLNIVPLALFIPFGVALLICELCLFFVHNPLGTMIAAIVLKFVLLPAVLFVAVMLGGLMLEISLLYGIMIIAGAALYGLCLVAMFVSYFMERKYYRY